MPLLSLVGPGPYPLDPLPPIDLEAVGADGDVLVDVRDGCIVHVADGLATHLSREDSIRIAREVLAVLPVADAGRDGGS
ncbi:MAG TPA: hypothetical protein VLT47_10975 [Anaeromyxobacteraceae bacterium]|nr:hypothetical protein [Anaeromyxobacteraceae bacterium]